jgi:hypothetical protein
MATVISCPSCSAPLAVTPEMVGQLIACPTCDQQIQLAGKPSGPPQPRPNKTTSSPAPTSKPQSTAGKPAAQTIAAAAPSEANANSISPALIAGLSVVAGLVIAGGILSWRYVATHPASVQAELPPSARIRPAPANLPPPPPPPPPPTAEPAINESPVAAPEPAPPAIQQPPASAPPPRAAPAGGFGGPQPPATNVAPQMPGGGFPAPGTASAGGPPGGIPPFGQFGPPPFPIPPPPFGMPPPGQVVTSGGPSPKSRTPAPQPPPANSPPKRNPNDPLDIVPTACRLPALISTSPEKLLSLTCEPREKFEVSVRNAAANILPEAAFFAQADASQQSWSVGYAADVNSGAGKTPVATIRREGLDLTLAWSQPTADLELRKQLGNCQLELRHGSDSRLVQLRLPLAAGPAVLDLTKDVQTIEFPVADLPRQERFHLDIQELVQFASGGKVRGNTTSLSLGKQAVIEFADQPGAEIRLRFFRPTATANPTLRIEPAFKENAAREFELTLPRLDALKKAAEENIVRDRSQLSDAKDALSNLKSKLDSARSNQPSNIQQLGAWQQTVAALARGVDKAGDRLQLLQRRIAENQARLIAEPKMREFLNSLHLKAEIRYVLSAECGEQDVILVDGTKARGSSES